MSTSDSPKSARSRRRSSAAGSSSYVGILNLNNSSFDVPSNSSGLQNGNSGRGRISNCDDNGEDESPIRIPIIGFEVMEERARFTVFKLRVENEKLNETWLVFRRYTDFERLHAKIREEHPDISINLPPKRWIRDNFETAFLEDRMKGLQAFVDSILIQHQLTDSAIIREFFCLDEPPLYPENAEESRAMYGSLEESIMHLKDVLNAKQTEIQILQAQLALVNTQHENLVKQTKNCRHCSHHRTSLNLPSPLHGGENSIPIASSTPNFSNSPVTRNRNSSPRSNHSSTSYKSANQNQTAGSSKSIGKNSNARNHPQDSPPTPTSSSPPIKNGHSILNTTTTTPTSSSSNSEFASPPPSETESANSSPKPSSKDDRLKSVDSDNNMMSQAPSVIVVDNS